MIKANELRIGNLVKGAADKIYTVDANIIRICSGSPDWVDPIPLTPEILEKAGFETEANANDDGLNYIKDHFIIDCNFKMVFESAWASFITIELKHVHQLQNLYFALTNEELTIEDLNDERSVATKSNSSNSVD